MSYNSHTNTVNDHFINVLKQIISSNKRDNFIKKVTATERQGNLDSLYNNESLTTLIKDDPNYDSVINYIEIYLFVSQKLADYAEIELKMIDLWDNIDSGLFEIETEKLLAPIVYKLYSRIFEEFDEVIEMFFEYVVTVQNNAVSNFGKNVVKGAAGLTAAAVGGAKMGKGIFEEDGKEFAKGSAVFGGSFLIDSVKTSKDQSNISLNELVKIQVKARNDYDSSLFSLFRLNAALIKLNLPITFRDVLDLSSKSDKIAGSLALELEDVKKAFDRGKKILQIFVEKFSIKDLLRDNLNSELLFFNDELIISDGLDLDKFLTKTHESFFRFDSLIDIKAKTKFVKVEDGLYIDHYKHDFGKLITNKYKLKSGSLNVSVLRDLIKTYDFENSNYLTHQYSAENTESNCFVVTATFDQNYLIIDEFRRFRDQRLSRSNIGSIVIKFYYFVGPILASFIKKNSFLKKVSYHFLKKVYQKIITKKA